MSQKTVHVKNTPQNFRGGKVSDYYQNWSNLTSDNWVLQTIQGNLLELAGLHIQSNTPHVLPLPRNDQASLDNALWQYAKQNIIEPCIASGDSYFSTLFPRQKPNGSVRVIFNLKSFNEQYMDKIHFKMETIRDVLPLVTPHCYFASIDLKDAYFSVPIAPGYRHMFRFLWKNVFWQFTCLPQGFSPAPRIFTKLLKPILSHLRARGIQIIAYIDDCLLIADCSETLAKAVTYTQKLFDKLGLTVHTEKSVLTATKKIEFLGFVLDSTDMTITLTSKKKDKIASMAQKMAHKSVTTIRDLASLIGNLVAADPAVPLGPLRYKFLEIERNKFLAKHAGNYEAIISLNENTKQIIQWWADNIHDMNKPIHTSDPDFEIFTDASLSGWGARFGDQGTGGQWAHSEITHINHLELKAAFLAVQSFCSTQNNVHIKIRSDNTTTVACINKAGSTKPALHQLTFDFLTWAYARGITFSASHIPGVENVEADRESRISNVDAEWMLKPSIFTKICQHFNYSPTIDMFATRINHQLPTYVAWRPDPQAYDIDALSFPWSDSELNPYCFPPFSIISQVLRKISSANASALVILPLWPTKPWFVRALQMLTAPPVLLPKACLTLPQDPTAHHPLTSKLTLAALMLSGIPSSVRAYQTTLPTLSFMPGDQELSDNIGRISNVGCSFVSRNKLIRFTHLQMKR